MVLNESVDLDDANDEQRRRASRGYRESLEDIVN